VEESFYFADHSGWFGKHFVEFEPALYLFAVEQDCFGLHSEYFETVQYYSAQHSIPDRPVEYQQSDR